MLTGDALTTALIPVTDRLISAVHALDHDQVQAAVLDAIDLAGDEHTALAHLVVLLAGVCSADHSAAATLGWTLDPAEYARQREHTDALTASLRTARLLAQGGA